MKPKLGRFVRVGAIIWIVFCAVASFKITYDSMMINTINLFNSVGDIMSIVMFFILSISLTLIISIIGFVAAGIAFQIVYRIAKRLT